MRQNTTNVLKSFIIFTIIFAFSVGSGLAQKTIKIGVASPFSGDLASYGVPVKNAVMIAADKINDQGGILGRKIEILMEDDVCEPNTATSVANKLVASGVVAVVGHLCSGATEAALAIYRNANVIVISPASTNPDLTLSGKNPNFFRTIAHDAAQANLQVNFAVNNLKIKKAAVIHDKGTYGKGLAELVKAGLEKNKVKVVMFEGITPGAVSYSALVSKIKRNKITSKRNTAVFFGGYHPEASKIVTEARKKRSNANFISGDGVKDPSFLKIAGRYALDYYVSAPTDVTKVPMARRVSRAYKKRFGSDPGTFSLQGYSALLAIANAIEKSGSVKYNAVVKTLRSSRVGTPLGAISFDKNGDIVGAGFTMYQIQPTFVAIDKNL